MIDDFFLRALAAGVGVALAAGPLGCFVVWRRMAYFGAALSHSALLGVALGFLLGINLTVGILFLCLCLALLLVGLERQRLLASDTLLGILAHGTLACGLVAIAFQETVRVDLLSYLFGDILAVSWTDLAWIFAGGALVLAAVVAIWRPLLAATVHEELARVEGVAVARVRLVFMVLLAVAIAVGLKVVGLLLIAALLIIPAAAARRLSTTPEQMALGAIAIGCLSVAGGLYGSLTWDAPAGPSIVVAATLLFAMASLVRKRG